MSKPKTSKKKTSRAIRAAGEKGCVGTANFTADSAERADSKCHKRGGFKLGNRRREYYIFAAF
jgi:hypothetical protein